MNSKICLYTPPLSDIGSYFEMIDIAYEYGIESIETINTFELAQPNLEKAEELYNHAKKRNVNFTCVSVGINLVGDDRYENIEKVKKYAEISAILKAPYLHHTIALEFKNPVIIKQNHDLYYQRGIEAVREIYDYAKTLGVQTIYEDQGYLFNGINGYKRFVEDVDRDIGMVADFGNIMFVEEKIEDFIPCFSKMIKNVHIKDYRFTKKDQREQQPGEFCTFYGNYIYDVPFGKGDVNFKLGFDELKKIGYKGYYAMECPPIGESQSESLKENITFLKNQIKKAGL